jgi:Icc-related predicted phosphoesterase
MKILYVTDLHGHRGAYDKILEIAWQEDVHAVINGGDMLPKGSNIFKIQKNFIKNFFVDHLQEYANDEIMYLGMLGNDDLRAVEDDWFKIVSDNPFVYDLTEGCSLDGWNFIGVNVVPDYPFGLKDRTVLDSRGWKRPNQISGPCLSDKTEPDGLMSISIREAEVLFEERDTMEETLENLRKTTDPKDLIAVIHTPPRGLGLGEIRGRDVGSKAVYDWVLKHQPHMTFHGHIHESPILSDIHTAKIGKTVCHQPGQRLPSMLSYSVIDLETKTATSRVTT